VAQVFLSELVGGQAKMHGHLPNSSDVAFLSPCREPPQLHIFYHPLTEWRHRYSPFGEGVMAPP
jgi:hypothetical protein